MKPAVVFLLLLMNSFSFADPLQDRADRIHHSRQEPSEGVVIGALRQGEMEFAAAGAIRGDGPGPDEDTLFEIGSITKVFTAILLAETVRAGKAKLGDPVANYLPGGVSGKDSPLRATITLASLATHTSGLPRLPGDLLEGADPANPYAHYDEQRLYAYLKTLKTEDLKKTGEYAYSNLGFGLLGNVLGHIWGKPYPELIRETIFEPLGMKSSLVPVDYEKLPEAVREKLAMGHNGGKAVPHWELGSFLGAGAILSSARDLLFFARAHWDEKTPEGLAASLREVRKERFPGVGLGWMISGEKVTHAGGTGGFRTNLTVNVAAKSAEVVLNNSAGESLESEKIGEFAGISGFWEGTLDAGTVKLRLVQYIGGDGRALSFSIDQGCAVSEATKVSYQNGKLTLSFPTIGGFYEGIREGDKISGTWTQTGELPLDLIRAPGTPPALQEGLAKIYPDDLTPLLGCWSGFIGGKEGLFVYFRIEKFAGGFLAQMRSPDQTPAPIPVSRLELKDGNVTVKAAAVGGTFSGALDEKSRTLDGTWNQGKDLSLKLKWSREVPER